MTRYLSLLALAVVLVAGPAFATDQTLTLTLEAPSLSSSTGAQTSSSTPAAKQPAKKAENTGDKVTVGEVGTVCVSIAYLYKSKSSSAGIYTSVKEETPLAIVRNEGDWYGVLMNNGNIGWIPKKNVRMSGYNLVADKSDLSRGSYTSRGGETMRSNALSASGGNELIKTALQYAGVRYVYGGTNPSTGMDCSAFVQMVFRQHGIKLPRTAREQALVGETVPFDQLQPGDRLYFRCKYSYIDHCGIYAGNGYFIHCSVSNKGVGVDSLASDFYWRSLVVAKRS